MSSDGKFFTKVKNAFKSDKKDTESSPNSSSKTSAPSASASKSHQKVIDEAYSEGRKFFHLKHSSSKGNIGSSSGSASGSGSSVEQGGKHSKDQHHDILRQAYKEGQKLFHYHAKHGVSSSTSQKQGTSPSTYAGAGVGATAGAGAGAVGASTGSGSPKTPSTPRENKSTTSSVASGLSHDREVIAESSIGRVVTSPPRRSREPLEHTIPGDFANEKRPTDSTVVVGGAAAAAGSGNAASGAQSTNASVDAPRYTDGAETVKGSGKYFDPKDTQGGVLGATKTDKDADAYNERTKAEYHDLSNLKTKPSYPEGTVEKGGDLETVKNLAYEEGKKKGKLDGDNGAFGTSNQSSTNFSSNSNPVEEKEIHQENKSAYNPGGVSAVFEENTTGPQATKSNAKSGSSGNTAAGVASGAAAGAGLAGVAASSGNSKQSSNDKSSSKGVYDISDAQGKDIPRNEIDHSSYKNTSSGLGSENLAAGSAATSSQIPASSNNEKQSLSDLEKKISETDARIRQLKQDPSNASTYAVHDEPIAAPELKDIDDGHNQVSYTDTRNATTATKVDNSLPEGVNSAGSAGIAAGATSALGAAAAYLGLSKGNKDTEPSDTAYSGAFKENQTSTLSKNAPTREVPASSYNEGQLKGLKDELYQAGYNQGKDIYAGIDKNSTKHRDALIASNSDGKGDNVNRSLDPSSTSSSGSSRPENSKEQAEAIAAAAGGFGAVGYGSSTSKGANATTGNANLASESGKTGYHDGSKNDLSKEAYQAGKAKANAEKNATASHVPRTEAYEAGKDKAKTDKNAIAGAVPTGEAYQAGKAKGYNEKDSSTSAVPRAEAYQAGKTQGYEDKDISASTVPREQAYQAGKNKAETERDSSTLKQSGDTLASTDSETSSPSKGYLAAAGAAIGGAVGYAFGGKGSKENDVDDSLIEDAEKVDPTISKLPQHKVDDKELKKETTLSRDATFDEKELVASNDRKIWEKDVEDYNKQHGFVGNKESLIQEAEDKDPSISKLPAHKVDKDHLRKDTTLGRDATFDEKELVAANDRKIWEKDAADYDKKHGFSSNSHKSSSTVDAPKLNALNDDEEYEDSNHEKSYLAAAGAAIGGAVGYAFGGKGPKENHVDDSLIEDAEKVDPTISKLPQHKVDDKELKRETTLSRDATFDEKELVASNDRKIWEKDADNYNKQHGFVSGNSKTPSHDSSLNATNRSATSTESNYDSGKPYSSSAEKQSQGSDSSEKGYLAAAGAAIGGAVGYAFGGKGSSKENEVDDSLIEDAEKVDPAILKLPPHKVDKDQLKKETTLSHDATFDDKELVASNDRKIWEKETDDYNKKHGFTNQTDSLIQEAAEVDPSITQLPAHKLKNQEGKEVKPKVAEANPEEVDTSAIQNFRKLEDDVSTYNKKHGHTGPQESLLAVAEEADPKILKLPTHKGDFNETKLVDPVGGAEPGEVQKLPANHPTARHREVSENIKSDKTVDAGTIQDSNKKHDHHTSTAVGTGAALGAGAGLAAGSSAHSHAAEQEPTHKSQLDPELKKDLYSQGYTKGRSSHSSGPSSTAAGTGAGLVAGSSAHSHSAEYDATHKSQLDSDLKKDLYSQGYTKGKSSHSSVPSSASDSHNHHRTVSGTSYNATKPINEGELPEPDLQDDVSGHDSRKSGVGIGAAALAGGAIGGGAAALATSSKHLDNNLKSELYEAGRSKGLAGSSQTGHADSTLDPKLQTTAYDAGQAKGLNTTGSTNLGLHPTLKEQLYNEGYTSATTGHPYLGKQDAKQDVGATREISSLDPTQNHKLYEPSHNQGYSDSAVQGNYSTANPSKSEVLDSKLKQDIYEHGYAKGSTEAKQEKQKASPYGHPTGSSNREAAVVGGAGLAGLAGLAAGAAGTFGHHKESPKYQQQDKNIESVEEVSAAESRASNKDDLVVEVIGIEDREEALNTAKKASKKLDAKGVDLTTGKLVINANTKEIYKAEEPEGLTNQSASKDIQSSGLSQNTSVGSRAPSSQPAADSTHSSSPSSTSGKVDTYQQTEAAKKRLAEAARKNVTSTQKHSNSGLTGGEATALGAGVVGTAGIASVAGHSSHKSTDVNHIPSHATVLKEIDPPNTHKHGYEGDGGISSQPPVKKQDTETSTSDDEIFVNVKGTKDNVLATKIARTAVARLQKTHASVVAKVKELQVDATSGIVRNENGQEIAQYPDLAVEKNKSGTESVGQGAKSLESPKHKDAISHGHSSKDHIKDRDTHSTGAAVTGGVAGTAAAAAAAAATAHGKSRNEPTASTHGQSSSRAISDAGTGHQDEKNVANTPQHHYGNQNVGSNSYSPDTYGSAIGTLGVQEKTAPAVTGIHSKGIGAAAYPELTNAGNTGLAKGTAPASTSATYGESPSADYSKSGATGAVPATYLNTSGAPTGSLNTAGVVGGAGFGDNSNTSSYHQTGREREYEAPSLQSESGLHTTQANKGSPLCGLALGETNIRGTNFASKDSNYSLSGSGAQSQHGQAVGNSEIPKSIGTTNVGNTNRYSVDNKNLSGRSTTGAGAGNTIAGDADDADSSFFSVAETSTYSMPGSWN